MFASTNVVSQNTSSSGYGSGATSGAGYGNKSSSGYGDDSSSGGNQDSTTGKIFQKVGSLIGNDNLEQRGQDKRNAAGGYGDNSDSYDNNSGGSGGNNY